MVPLRVGARAYFVEPTALYNELYEPKVASPGSTAAMTGASGYSVVDELLDGGTMGFRGEGTLTLQQGQDGPPAGPGRVRFGLRYAPDEGGERHNRAIKLSFEALDDGGREILGWKPAAGRAPLPRYDLAGTMEAGGDSTRVFVEPVMVDHTMPATMHAIDEFDFAWKVRAGSGLGETATSVRAIVPNLAAPDVDIETAGMRVRLETVLPDAEHIIADPANAGRVLPTCLLNVERVGGEGHDDVAEAVEVFGWLLSFYAGGAVHPSAWEGDTARGRTWCLRAHDVRRLPVEARRTCLPRSGLEPFLRHGYESWRALDATRRGRLRGVVNLYAQILASTYPTQQIALTAMYLERFRELVLGNETVLEQVGAKEKGFDEDKVAKMLKDTLNNLVEFVGGFDADDRAKVRRSINGIGGGHVSGLFRPSFQRQLEELYGRARLGVDRDELRTFIAERNAVVHGYWDPSPEGAMGAHRLAEYGTNLLEKLILRFFRYDGPYYDRTSGGIEPFEHQDPSW